jgi:hypothetical protein
MQLRLTGPVPPAARLQVRLPLLHTSVLAGGHAAGAVTEGTEKAGTVCPLCSVLPHGVLQDGGGGGRFSLTQQFPLHACPYGQSAFVEQEVPPLPSPLGSGQVAWTPACAGEATIPVATIIATMAMMHSVFFMISSSPYQK